MKGLGVNLMGTTHVFDLTRTHDIKRVVNISSATVLYSGFGGFGPEPFGEDVPLRNLSEGPASLYALTKQTGEHLGLLYRKLYGADIVSLRFGAVVGGDVDGTTSVPGAAAGNADWGGETWPAAASGRSVPCLGRNRGIHRRA